MELLPLIEKFGLPTGAILILAWTIWKVLSARIESLEKKGSKTDDVVTELNKYIRDTLSEKLSEAHARERAFMEMIHRDFKPDDDSAHKTDTVLKSIYKKDK